MIEVDNSETETVWLSVDGMSCGSCAANVERALRGVAGVTSAAVDLGAKRARVQGAVAANTLAAAVQRAGYEARPIGVPSEQEESHGRGGCC